MSAADQDIKFSSLALNGSIRHYNNTITQALGVMKTCKQVYRETRGLFFYLNQVSLYGTPSVSLQRLFAGLLRDTPSALCSNLNRVVLRPEDLQITTHRDDFDVFVTGLDLDRTARFVGNLQGIRPFKLYIGANLVYHRWGGRDRHVCKRDAPVTGDDCGLIELIFPIDDRAAALEIVERLHQKKLSILAPHRQHRMCTVRIELQNILDGLSKAHRQMLLLVDRMCKIPDQVTKGKA